MTTRMDARWRQFAEAVVLALLAIMVYLPAVLGEFIWDDKSIYITENPLLPAPDGLYRFWFSDDPVDYYPLTYTTFWFEWRCWGAAPAGYHLGNLVCHAASTVLIWQILRRLGLNWAWWAAALFAVHPLNVETVAWISQRKSLLAAALGFSAILVFLHDDLRRRAGLLAASTGLFALSLAAKPTMIGLPILVPVYYFLRYGRIQRRDLATTIPFVAVAILFGAVGVYFQSHRVLAGEVVRDEDLPQRILSAARAMDFYIWKTILPINLCFVYPRWTIKLDSSAAYFPILPWPFIAFFAWRARRGWGRPVLAAFAYYVVTLAPALGFVDVYYWRYSYVADHYQYQSMIAIVALTVWIAEQLWRPISERWIPVPLIRWLSLAPVVLIGVLALSSWRHSGFYASEETLWRETIRQNPRAWLAFSNLGVIADERGQLDEAVELYRRAIAIEPDATEARINLGGIYTKRGNLESAIEQFEEVLRRLPGNPVASVRLAAIRLEQGRVDDAKRLAETGLLVDERHAELLITLARVHEMRGEFRDAERLFRDAIESDASMVEARHHYGVMLDRIGRPREALTQLQAAAKLKPEDSRIWLDLGNAFVSLGAINEAQRSFREALRLSPRNAETHVNLGVLLAQGGDVREARQHFLTAVQLDPRLVSGYANLAAAHAAFQEFADAVSVAQEGLVIARRLGDAQMAAALEQQVDKYKSELPEANK